MRVWALVPAVGMIALACGGEAPQVPQAKPATEDPGGATEARAQHEVRVQTFQANRVLLEAMTLQLARELRVPRIEPLFEEILREGEGAPRIREAVELFPETVESLVSSGEWRPQDLKEWKWLVITALHSELFDAVPESLRLAGDLENSPTRWISAGLRFTPDEMFADIVTEGLRHEDPRNRAYTAFALSARGYEDYVGSLRALMDDPHPWARVNAIASLVRLGDEQGTAEARDLLFLQDAERSPQVIALFFEALERAAPAEKVLAFARSVQERLAGPERAAVDAILVLHGTDEERESTSELRALLPVLDPMAPEVHRGVRALSRAGGAENVAVLAQLFARENSQTVTLELAAALAKAGHPEARPLLRSAARDLPWNQGLLALASAHRVGGDARLLGWATEALAAGDQELARRVGWALGVWSDGAPWVDEGASKSDAQPPGWGIVVQAAQLGRLSRPGIR